MGHANKSVRRLCDRSLSREPFVSVCLGDLALGQLALAYNNGLTGSWSGVRQGQEKGEPELEFPRDSPTRAMT